MKKNNILRSVLFLLGAILLVPSCKNKPAEKVEVKRIISLAPNITEILFSLGVQDKIVGVSDYCTFPEEAALKESVGGLFNPSLEKITALKPDLILATNSYQNLEDKLGKGRFNIVLFPEKTVNDIYVTIDSIGTLTNTQDRAQELIRSIRDSLTFYKANTADKRPAAILVLGRDPGTTRNIGISGPGAFVNELWEWSGGRNAFPNLQTSFAQINREDLLTTNPEIVIEFKPNKNFSLGQENRNREEWADLQISAVENKNIFIIPGNQYLIPGPRMYLLAKEYSKILQRFHY
jgi:cobalamin transport system substrate-binding protein